MPDLLYAGPPLVDARVGSSLGSRSSADVGGRHLRLSGLRTLQGGLGFKRYESSEPNRAQVFRRLETQRLTYISVT